MAAKNFIILFICIQLVQFSVAAVEHDKWVHYVELSKKLYVSSDSLDFDEANTKCNDLGGKLYEPLSLQEYKVFPTLINDDNWYWLGMRVSSHQDKRVKFRSNSMEVRQTAFADGEPDNRGNVGEVCVATDPQKLGRLWHDRECSTKMQYVCERGIDFPN